MSTELRTGDAVQDVDGHIGLVTDEVKKSGPSKGMVTVLFAWPTPWGRWEIACDPAGLQRVVLQAVDPV